MATPTRKLIDALRVTARRIESGEYRYQWTETAYCNCGLLAATVLGMSPQSMRQRLVEIDEEVNPFVSLHEISWSAIAIQHAKHEEGEADAYFCHNSGLSVKEIVDALLEAGMVREDFHNLELLDGLEDSYVYDVAESVVRYMRRWADNLEAETTTQTLMPGQ